MSAREFRHNWKSSKCKDKKEPTRCHRYRSLFSCSRIPTFTQCPQLVSQLCTTAANTTRHTPHAVVYVMGIMMPETCWVNLMRINIYTCGI